MRWTRFLVVLVMVAAFTHACVLWGVSRAAEPVRDNSQFGLNFTLGPPVFDPNTASHNLNLYLEWAEQQGFKKEARIVCDWYWGQKFTEPYWLPVFAVRGWKVSCIVGVYPGGWKKADYIAAHIDWTQRLVDRWGPHGENILIQIEPINEPWNPKIKFKKSWIVPYHQAIKRIANEAGLPTAAGYGTTKDVWKYYKKAGFNWDTDTDLVAFNTLKGNVKNSMEYRRKRMTNFDGRLVITEAQYKIAGRTPAQRMFLYTCIGENTGQDGLNICPASLPGLRYEDGQPEQPTGE